MGKKQTISNKIQELQKEFDTLFAEIESTHGYRFSFGMGTKYDQQGNLYFKLQAIKVGSQSLEDLKYERERIFLKLPPLQTCLHYGTKRYTVLGLNKTGTKLLGKNEENGAVYLLPLDIAQMAWRLQREAEEKKDMME